MTPIRSFVLATALAVAGSSAPNAQSYIFHADQDAATHQLRINSYPNSGYRILSMAVHGSLAAPRYTTVWAWRSGPEFVAFHSLDRSAFNTFHFSRVLAGWRPHIVTTCGGPLASDTVYAGVYVRDGATYRFEWGIDIDRLYLVNDQAMNDGQALTSLGTSGSGAETRYCALWTPTATDGGYGFSLDDSVADLQSRFNAFTATGVRPSFVSMSPAGRYFGIWRDDVLTGGWAMRADMDVATCRTEVQTRLNAGLHPISIAAGGTGAGTRYAAVFVAAETTVAKQWRSPTGVDVPGFEGFDTYMRTLMEQNQVRAASLAVARHGKLILARGYNFAEPSYPTAQPTSLFRIGSVSKTITATAAHRQMQRGGGFGLSLQSRLTNELPLYQPGIRDPRLHDVTLAHLLSHASGYDTSILGYDPTNRDHVIAAHYGTSLPITTAQMLGYMSYTQMLQHAPGEMVYYSNYGMRLVGSILEERNSGLGYEAIVRRDIFEPLGLSRPQIIRPFYNQVWPGEVRYHARSPHVVRSVCSATEPWVVGQYGGFNPVTGAPAGAWVMAAPDLAKYLSAFDLANANPILSQASTNTMWTLYDPAKSANALRGWWRLTLRDESNANLEAVEHNGGLAGANALIVRRADGLSFALLLNRDIEGGLHGSVHGRALNNLANQVAAWPDHDLFPGVGIPSHTFPAAQVTGTSANAMPNVTRTPVRILGTGLTWADRVQFAGNVVLNQDDRDVGRGWFRVDSDTQISFLPPQGMSIGSKSLRVGSQTNGWSNTINLGLVEPLTPTLVGPQELAGTGRIDLHVAKGATTTPQSALLLFLSGSNLPSYAAGVISLGLGNGFSDITVWPSAVSPSAVTGAGLWFATNLPDLNGAQISCEGVVVDFGAANLMPLPTTNTVRVTCN
jgi:CubicO group peptidase (beta-lactamase class C family)